MAGMSTATTTKVYEIPETNFVRFQEDLAKLAKRADKLGVVAPSFTIVDTEDREVLRESINGGFLRPTGEIRRYYHVTVTGGAPCYAGWTLTAVIELDHEEPDTPNVVDAVGEGVEIDPAWRTTGDRCDHCGVDGRGRNKLVVVTHESGERKIVGTTCLRDFLGHTSPERIADWATLLADFDPENYVDDDAYGSAGGGERRYEPITYLAFVVRSTRENGWTPRSAVRFGDTATADDAADLFALAAGWFRPGRNEVRPAEPTAAELALATAAHAWGAEQGGNDYLDNLSAVCQKTSLRRKHIGLAASVVSAYERHLGREAERKAAAEATAASVHVGAVKDRIAIDGTVTFVRFFEGDYGTRALVKILDHGNVLVWWCSNAANAPEVGEVVTGKATVKAHEDYQGTAQTVITRAKLDPRTVVGLGDDEDAF